MKRTIHFIRPASLETTDLLSARLEEFAANGWTPIYDDLPVNRDWPFSSSYTADRSEQLNEALLDTDSDVIWSARGGYGCSDLLPFIPWTKLKKASRKLIIGFSDVSALHSAFYTKLKWAGLHAPMPATKLWAQNGEMSDINAVLSMLEENKFAHQLVLPENQFYIPDEKFTVAGTLFGGCFSVLTNLIGTEYFPESLAGHIVFLEDTSESPGRLARYLNQWIQSGVLAGVKAIILGSFRECCEPVNEDRYIHRMFAERTKLPILVSQQFGHSSPNYPMMIGAQAEYRDRMLTWTYRWPATSKKEA